MSGRELPASLRTTLRRVHELEVEARGTRHERRAIAATSALLLAAHQAGWQQIELARFLGMNQQTVQKRIATTRRLYAGERPAIVVDVPPERPPARLAPIAQPVEHRQWLTIGEAAAHVHRSRETIRNWLNRGVLPNTDRRGNGVHLYLRADLDRVVHGPHRGPRGRYPRFDELLDAIAAAPV